LVVSRFKFQGLLRDGDQEVRAEYRPDLASHGFPVGSDEGVSAQVLFDPFEEQFDLPSGAAQLGNLKGAQGKVVGQKKFESDRWTDR